MASYHLITEQFALAYVPYILAMLSLQICTYQMALQTLKKRLFH